MISVRAIAAAIVGLLLAVVFLMTYFTVGQNELTVVT